MSEEKTPEDLARERARNPLYDLTAGEVSPEIIRTELGRQPFDIAAQSRMFKAGLMGLAVTVWSSYDGGHNANQLEYEPGVPLVIRLDDDMINDQIQFAGGYICGWTESTGGTLDKLKIWLEPLVET